MRTITQKLLSGSFLRTVSLILNGAVSFLLFPFLVHHLGDRLYGFWSVVAAFVGYYGLLDFGLSMAVCQYISGAIGKNDVPECNLIFNSALRIYSMLGGAALLVTAILAGLAPLICHNPQDAALFWRVILILGFSVALTFPLKAYLGLLFSGLRFTAISAVDLLTLSLRTGLTVWVVLAGHKLLAISWVTLLASLPGTALVIWLAMRDFPWLRIHFGILDRKLVKSLLSYSLYVFAGDIGDRLRFQVDTVVIAAFLSLAAVTHYRVASVFSGYYMQVMIAIMGVLQPLLSQLHALNDHARVQRVFFLGTKVSLVISGFICFGLIAWGKAFIQRWMGPQYLDAYLILVILTLALLLDLSQSPSVNLLYATFKHRFYAYLNMSEGIINLVVSLILMRRYGVVGVAMGTLVAAILIRIIAQPWWVCKVSNISYSFYVRFLMGNVFRISALIGVVYAAVSWGIRPDYRYLFGSAFLATAIYGAGCWVFVLNKQEREQCLSALQRGTVNVTSEETLNIPSLSEVTGGAEEVALDTAKVTR